MRSNESILFLKAYTWPRDSHGLFDYESQSITKNRIKIQNSCQLHRCENSILQYSIQSSVKDSQPFLSIEKTSSGYSIKPETGGEMWMVIDCKKTKTQTKGYKLNKGEVVKLGRVRYIVKDVCGYEDEVPTSQEKPLILNPIREENLLCRICLGEEENADPLISPCGCGGTMKYIHLSCFRKWIESKTSKKQIDNSYSYHVKALTCEISRCRIAPSIVVQDQIIDLLSIPKVEPPYITLESSISEKHEYSIHLISLNNKTNIRLGRGHDSDIRISDISVSRCHAAIKFTNGEFFLEDNNSKFGTLVEEKEMDINKGNPFACIQVGRTLLVFSFNSQENEGQDISIEETDEEQD